MDSCREFYRIVVNSLILEIFKYSCSVVEKYGTMFVPYIVANLKIKKGVDLQ